MTRIFINVELKVTAAVIHFRMEFLSILVLQQTQENQSWDNHIALEYVSNTQESLCSFTAPWLERRCPDAQSGLAMESSCSRAV